MNWKPGLILRIKNYRFEDNNSTRDKYSIVLFANNDYAYLIHSLTTSRNNFNVEALNYGCTVHKHYLPYYFFPANQVVGDDGYFFEKDTFIFFQSNVRKESFSKFDAAASTPLGLISLGTLTNEELKRLIKCALKSKFIPQDIAKELSIFKQTL
jgi:UDP:flavonoid glycosyltransferase YjiC (YdhE family)